MSEISHKSSFSRWLGKVFLVAVLYFITGRLGLLMAVPPGYATAVWPPSGFALGSVLVFGYSSCLGVLAGSFLVNIWTTLDTSSLQALFHSCIPAFIIALGATLQAGVGSFLVKRVLGYPLFLSLERDVLSFLFLAGPVSCFISSSVGVSTLVFTGAIKPDSAVFSWWTWWIGDSIGAIIFAPIMMMFIAQPRRIWLNRLQTVALPMMITFLLMVVLFVFMKNADARRIRQDFDNHSNLMYQSVQFHVSRNLDVLYALQSFYKSSSSVERDEFTEFTKSSINRHNAITALEWDPKVVHGQRADFEAEVQKSGLKDFEIKEIDENHNISRSGQREVYFPILYAEPFEQNKKVLGFDFMSEKSRHSALERAWRSGELSLTRPIKLIQGPLGVISFLSIYKNGVELKSGQDRENALLGFVVEVLNFQVIAEKSLEQFREDNYILHIFDNSIENKKEEMITWDTGLKKSVSIDLNKLIKSNKGFMWGKEMSFGGRHWQFEVYPTTDYFIAKQGWTMWFILAGGLLFVGFLGGFLLIRTGREEQISLQVEARTEELNIANRKLIEEIGQRAEIQKALERRQGELEEARVNAIQIAQTAQSAQLAAENAKTLLQKQAIELKDNIEELEKFNQAAVNREERIIELKQKINKLSKELGRETVYDLSFLTPGPDK